MGNTGDLETLTHRERYENINVTASFSYLKAPIITEINLLLF